MAAFTIKDLTFAYPLRERPALSNINLTIEKGEFVTLCGKSGCGKSTLLRSLKTVLCPNGEKTGEIYFFGKPLDGIDQREQAGRIGFVLQNPDNQLVTDKVWHELAFGLESLGFDTKTIRLRVAEMASFFGIQAWSAKNVSELSGGQKQLLNLAAVMVMQPDVLILDEPTSQLDPIAAGDFLATVGKINQEIGTTVIITEHRLDDVLPMSDRAIVMDKGEIIIDDIPANTGAMLAVLGHDMFMAMPAPLQAYAILYEEGIGKNLDCPVTVRDGRNWLSTLLSNVSITTKGLPPRPLENFKGRTPVIGMKDVWFRYDQRQNDVVKDLSLEVYAGELFCMVGGNGTGKTTAITLMSGINKAYRGKVFLKGKEIQKYKSGELFSGLLGVLPQNPQALFVAQTVRLDLMEILDDKKDKGGKPVSLEEKEGRIAKIAELTDIAHLLSCHPYDLSGGEQQRAALAKILLLEPEILLLDEPTKGIDNHFKVKLAGILSRLKESGVTIVMVSHDVEFCGKYADRCAMFFDGNIVTINTPDKFFSGNSFYTTAANRMSRHMFENAITAADIAELCRQNLKGGGDPALSCHEPQGSADIGGDANQNQTQTPTGSAGNQPGESESAGVEPLRQACCFCGNPKIRKIISLAAMLVLAPATLIAGALYMDDRKYYFLSLMIIAYSMIPVFMLFERRKPQAREIIIIAVMIAIAVAVRAAFFMLPLAQPVLAVIIIAGVCLGGEAGFLVGAMTAFVSNFMFGQGPWTPWQMFAMGIVGLLAGFLGRKGWLKKRRAALMVFGALATFFVYGGIVDLWTILGMTQTPTIGTALTVYGLALPFNTLHAAATGTFLYFLTNPLIDKLERVKIKYGCYAPLRAG